MWVTIITIQTNNFNLQGCKKETNKTIIKSLRISQRKLLLKNDNIYYKGFKESLSPFLQVIKNKIYNLLNKFSKVI